MKIKPKAKGKFFERRKAKEKVKGKWKNEYR